MAPQSQGADRPDSNESGENIEDIFNAMTGETSSPSEFPNSPAVASSDEVSAQESTHESQWSHTIRGTQRNDQGHRPHTQKCKGDTLDQQIVSLLDRKMTENEAFGLSVGMTIDRWPKQKTAACKAQIMKIITELE